MATPFTLPKLPWSEDALSPVISSQTISFHYGKHHQAYVTNLNKLTEGKPYAEMPLEKIIVESHSKDADKGIFNNAAQVWNHTFYWHSLAPKSASKPGTKLAGLIDKAFGGFDNFKKEFAAAGNGQFGSGWAWLVADKAGALKITKTGNAENPLIQGLKPLLTIDVWEHAYYLDYQNRRPDYTAAVVEKLLNWDFAEKNLG